MVEISACVLHTPRHHRNQEICAMKPPSMEFMPLVNELRGLISLEGKRFLPKSLALRAA